MRAVVALLALVAGCGATVRPAVPRFIARSLRTPVMAAALPSLASEIEATLLELGLAHVGVYLDDRHSGRADERGDGSASPPSGRPRWRERRCCA